MTVTAAVTVAVTGDCNTAHPLLVYEREDRRMQFVELNYILAIYLVFVYLNLE